jgi:hypothetical protein
MEYKKGTLPFFFTKVDPCFFTLPPFIAHEMLVAKYLLAVVSDHLVGWLPMSPQTCLRT